MIDSLSEHRYKILSGTLLTSDGQKISYHHYKNNHSKVVIIAHGFYTSKNNVLLRSLAEFLFKQYDVFIFDFRGHGESGDLFYWTSKEDNDLIAVLDYLRGKYNREGLIAFSLGALVSFNVLSKRNDVDSLITVSGLTKFKKIDYRFWKLDWENDIFYNFFKEGRVGKGVRPGPFWLNKVDAIDVVDKIKIPILYIHGDKDWVIRPWHSQVLYEKTKSKKKIVIIENGPHAEYLMRKSSKEFTELIKDWFEETL